MLCADGYEELFFQESDWDCMCFDRSGNDLDDDHQPLCGIGRCYAVAVCGI